MLKDTSNVLQFLESHLLIGLCQMVLVLLFEVHIALVAVRITVFGAECVSARARKLARQRHLLAANPAPVLLLLHLLYRLLLVLFFLYGHLRVIVRFLRLAGC